MATGLGTTLHRFRTRAGLSQQELADRAGVSVRGLRDLEQGRVARPRAQSVLRLVTALGLSDAERDLLLDGTASAPAKLRVAVLGPLAVSRGGNALELRSPLARDLLGLLAVQPNRVVGRDEIVDTLWGEDPPRTCVRLLNGYVGQLRALLEPDRPSHGRSGGRLALLRSGYRLTLDANELDLLHFDELAIGGRDALDADDQAAAEQRFGLALDCWRGPVLADAGARLRAHPAVVAVESRRLAAGLAEADVNLGSGRYEPATVRLRELAADQPLHEGLTARLMLALAGAGEQAAALQLFGTVRERLAEELGIEPGPELQEAQLRVLRGQVPVPAGTPAESAPAHPTPAQLPTDLADFTGRDRHLRALDATLVRAGRHAGVVIATIAGTAGVGKTALAIRWAHRVRDRFPDGQLYVNLRGYAPGSPLRPIDALARFLRALGVPAERVPTDQDEAADLYRTLLAGRRVLVMLDNAQSPDQVRPLLPGSAGCFVLVTSRDALSGLVARDGARRIDLDVLGPEEAEALLRRVLGDERVQAEPAAIAELARLCAHLPLALRIAAANVDGQSGGTIDGYVTRLRAGDRLAALEVEGDEQAVVRAAFGLSYAGRSAPAQRMFRLLGLVPGPEVTAVAAAALTGEPLPEAERLLGQLTHAHLLSETSPGRYAFHDLLRLYALGLCLTEESRAERDAATGQLYDFYLRAVDAAARLLYPEKLRHPMPPTGGALTPSFDHAGASGWLDAERVNLLAAITAATTAGPRARAWQLADGLRGYFFLRLSAVDWLTAATAGHAAAVAEGDPSAQAATELSLADLHWFRGDPEQAIDGYASALALARQDGWIECQAAALANLGLLYRQSARWTDAIEHYTQALELNRQAGRLAGQAVSLANLGVVYWELGRLDAAADNYAHALELYRTIGSRVGEATTLANLGEVQHLLGRPDEALAILTTALAQHREMGDRGNEAETLRSLAALHRDAGRDALARELGEAALDLAQDTGHHRLEADVRNTLASIRHRDDPQHAARHYQRALDLARDTATQHAEAQALIGLATTEGQPGEQSVEHAEAALTLTRQAGFRLLEGHALTAFASIRLAQDRPDQAREQGEQALAVHSDTGHRLGLAQTHLLLARVARRSDDPGAAREHGRRALALFIELGSPEAVAATELADQAH